MSDHPSGGPDPDRLCIHTITTRPLSIEQAIDAYQEAGVRGITVWENAIEGRDPAAVGERIRAGGLQPVALCRGGFFVHPDPGARTTAIEHNRDLVRTSAAIGAPLVVLVCGAHPEVPLPAARDQIAHGIEQLVPLAEELGVGLAIEPLHPMYADTRSAVNTMASANELAERLAHPLVGVAVDVYHVWWDPDLDRQIARCGGNIMAFHVCDWRSPTRDLLNDRGLMGSGCIPIRAIRTHVEEAGFDGYIEVEIFSDEYWSGDQEIFISDIVSAYGTYV